MSAVATKQPSKTKAAILEDEITTLAQRMKLALARPPSKTQRALADACGVQPPSVNGWLTGSTKSIEGTHLLKAAAFLEVNPRWLADGVGPMRAAPLDERIDPYTAILNACACMEVAANDGGTDVKWALLSLIEKASERVSAAVTCELVDYSEGLLSAASNELAGVLGLLDALNLVEESLMGPVETLVIVCKNEIDRTLREHYRAEVQR